MFELILQNSFVDTVWGTITAVTIAFTTVSGIAIYWTKKVRDRLVNSKSENAKKLLDVLDNYVIPALQQGEKVAEVTARQEVKAKQFGEILYTFMGDKADEIKDKYEVKLSNLSKDVDDAMIGTVEYNTRIQELEKLLAEIKADITK
jgi:hypothetical protein